jgi:hypothetical protein
MPVIGSLRVATAEPLHRVRAGSIALADEVIESLMALPIGNCLKCLLLVKSALKTRTC